MKITFISEYFPYPNEENITGGVESRCLNIAKRLSNNHKITVITSWREGEEKDYNFGKIKIKKVGKHHPYTNKGSILSRLNFAFAAYKESKKIDSDIIEGYNFISYLPAFYSAKSKTKKIATYHETWKGDWEKNKGFLVGFLGEIWESHVLSRNWDKIISVSNFTKERLQKYVNKEIEVIPNGINLSEYKEYKKYPVPTICCISRLTNQKRILDLVMAIEKISKEKNIKCIIIGQGPDKEILEKYIKEKNLSDIIKLTGYIESHEKVREILSKSHIFCLPSVLEGFGIVLAESCAAKVPYICSDIPVLKEVTNNGVGGLMFKKENIEDLKEKINLLIENKEIYSKKVKECEELVKIYNWDKISKDVENIYNTLK